MPLQSKWAAVRFGIIVEVNGNRYEAVQYVASFELNSIPTCSLTVAVGRNVRTQEPAQAHKTLGDVKLRNFISVKLKMQALGSDGGAPNFWPADEFPIFLGYVTGTGWKRSTSGAAFTIHAEHWLGDLNYSSAVSGSSHPGNPAAFTYPAGHRHMRLQSAGGELSGAPAGSPLWVPHFEDGEITASMAEDDLWARVLQPWLVAISQDDPIDKRLIGPEDPLGNDAALAILTGSGEGDEKFEIKSENMGMSLDGPNTVVLGNSIGMSLQKTRGENLFNTTLWGKVIGEWSPAYWFTVVPRVSDAIVAPFVGALAGQEWAVIKEGDYVQCDLHGAVPQALRAVGLHCPVEWITGANVNGGFYDAQKGGLAAVWPQTDMPRKGVVMMKDIPSWLADAVHSWRYGLVAEGVQPRQAIGNAAGDPKDVGPAMDPPEDPNKSMSDYHSVLIDYAHQWFVLEQLKGRVGELSGRLRFDIAPGSQVKVEAGSDPFIQDDALSQPFWASVSKVTYLINSEAQRAGTSFTLAHIRNEKENEDPFTSVERPPLYKEGWRGKAMVDLFAPGV